MVKGVSQGTNHAANFGGGLHPLWMRHACGLLVVVQGIRYRHKLVGAASVLYKELDREFAVDLHKVTSIPYALQAWCGFWRHCGCGDSHATFGNTALQGCYLTACELVMLTAYSYLVGLLQEELEKSQISKGRTVT